LLNEIRNRQGKHLIAYMRKSYEETSAYNPGIMATISLFIVYRKVALEGVLVALGQAAAVGENSLQILFGSYFRKWW
jgi:hypothetical protein